MHIAAGNESSHPNLPTWPLTRPSTKFLLPARPMSQSPARSTTRKQAFSTGWEGPKEPVSQPVPRNHDQWPRLKTPGFSTGALGLHWYRLVFPTGTNYLFPFFPNPGLFVIFITVYSFIFAKRTQTLQYYTFIGRSCSFSENIWN